MSDEKELYQEQFSLKEILQEVADWENMDGMKEEEATSPFIPLVTPEKKPVPPPSKKLAGEAREADLAQPKQAGRERAAPALGTTPPKQKKRKRSKETLPPAEEAPALPRAEPAAEEEAVTLFREEPPEEEVVPAVRDEIPYGFDEEETPWLSSWAETQLEELRQEFGPAGAQKEAVSQQEEEPLESRSATEEPPVPESGEQEHIEPPKSFGHLTLLPPVKDAHPELPEDMQEDKAGEEQPQGEPDSEKSREADEPAEQAPEALEVQGPPEAGAGSVGRAQQENDQANQEADEAEEANAPDNLIPFFPQKEPETIREAVEQTSQKAKVWLRLRQDKVMQTPKATKRLLGLLRGIRLPRLPRLPDLPEPPDTPPKVLARQYGDKLSRLRMESMGALLLSFLLLLTAVISLSTALSFLDPLREGLTLGYVSLGLFVLLAVLTRTVLIDGVTSLLRLRPAAETAALLATVFVLADGVSVLFFEFRAYSLPFFAPVALVLTFQQLGIYWYRSAQRVTCRTAAVSAEPDLLTKEPQQYNGKAVYRRRPGEVTGFGSQVQQEDGSRKRFRFLMPLFCLLAVGLSLWATLGKEAQQGLVFWSLSASLTAAATLSGTLCYSLPFHGLSRRLSKLGAALAGWPGIRKAQKGTHILVEDTDLFPPGAIEMTSYRAFNGHSMEKVISVTASLIRASGSGLDTLFHNLMRVEDGAYVTVTELEVHNDGVSAQALGEPILVGSANFLERLGVALPTGIRVKTGVMTAIGGRFAGQFVLDYSMHKTSMPAMDALLLNKIIPVLIAMDFNMVLPVLRKQFRFPWDKMAFPDLTQRSKLAGAPRPRDSVLLAVLSREGLAPLAIATAGAQRLSRAVKLCTRFTCLGALVGIFLVFYLSMAGALTALSAVSLSIFLALWFIPVALISGWVNQF